MHCIYHDDCRQSLLCDDFTAATDEAEELVLLDEIAQDRELYDAEWQEYIKDYQ